MSRPKPGIAIRVAICTALIWGMHSVPALADAPPSTVRQGAEKNGSEEPEATVEGEQTAARQEAIPVFNEGVAALEANDMPTALGYFVNSAEIDPDFPEAQNATAAIALELKNFQIAADAAEELLRLQPDNANAMGTAYFAELMIGDIDRLIPSARRLADVSPEMVSNEMLQHARVLFDDNEVAGSRALLEVILEREPELAPAYFQLGLTCNTLGDVDCAKQALARFLEIAPDDPNAATAQSLLDYL